MTFRGCYEGANVFIQRHFYDCIYTTRDFVGFTLGMLSISCWVVAQVPQFISNIRNQSAEALSPWFLAQWLLGDTCNLLGCLLQGQQLPTTTYTAMYFVLSDMVMMVQYIYYGALQKRRERILRLKSRKHRHHRHHHHHSSHEHAGPSGSSCPAADEERAVPLLEAYAVPSSSTAGQRIAHASAAVGSLAAAGMLALTSVHLLRPASSLAGSAQGPAWRSLLQNSGHHSSGWDGEAHDTSRSGLGAEAHFHDSGAGGVSLVATAGYALGWISATLYITARASQIMKNQQRRSAEGLSPMMFACAVTANLLSGISMFLRAQSIDDIVAQGPWMVGTLGTVALDIFILTQAFRFGIKAKAPEEDAAAGSLESPLLGPPPS